MVLLIEEGLSQVGHCHVLIDYRVEAIDICSKDFKTGVINTNYIRVHNYFIVR